MRRPAALAALACAALLNVVAATAAEDELAHAAVPSAERRHGEVSVLRRGNEVVVRTVLWSRALRQVAGRIADKERRNWPAGAPGHDDAERYVEALAEAVGRVPGVPDGATGEDRRRGLRIEFVLGPGLARVSFDDPDVAEDAAGRLRVRGARPILAFEPTRAYVERNQRLIVEDAMGLDGDAARALLDRAAGR